MPDSITIPKNTTSFPEYLDFSKLRETGIEHLQNLSSDLWTDYNLHDPGITILEVLCYALTDLGYRTNFDIRDILTRSNKEIAAQPKTILGQPFDDNFFTAAEILTCNPVTINDFRKLLIDIPGVKNAFFVRAEEGELPIYLNKKERKLQCEKPEDGQEIDRVKIKGLYDVCIELEPIFQIDACGKELFSKINILQQVHKVLNTHRNLCEDVREVLTFGEEQIALCAEIELKNEADAEDVLLEIHKNIEEFLSPTLRFYTLQEMLQKGKSVEEIFEGRPLSTQSHGFIDEEDLMKLEPKNEIYASDIYRIIMDIEAVQAVKNLVLINTIDNVPQTKGEKWCLPLTPKYRPHFDLEGSRINFFKGELPFFVNKNEVQQRYLEEKTASIKAFLDPYQLDLPIPSGTHRDLADYFSIQNDFPLTYGIGEEGIKGIPTTLRRAQACQLKAYLLFFDQILANYLSQLKHIRELFSFRIDTEKPGQGQDRTYFTQALTMVPGIEKIIKNLHDCPNNDADSIIPEDYPGYLNFIIENAGEYQDRRNRFLDHLLARFSESFTDYVLLMYKIENQQGGDQRDQSRIIQDKADFLQSYPDISRNRGRAFDYSANPNWNTENISGLEKRVAKLLGIDNVQRRTLGHAGIVVTPEGFCFEIQNEGHTIIRSKKIYPTKTEAETAFASFLTYAEQVAFYRKLSFEKYLKFGFTVQDDSGNILARGGKLFVEEAERAQTIEQILTLANNDPTQLRSSVCEIEGGHWIFGFCTPNNDTLLRGAITFENETAATTAANELRPLLVNRKNFHLADQFKDYGFFIVDEIGNCLAQSVDRFVNEHDRDAQIQALIGQVLFTGMSCEIVPEIECYTFELYDYQHDRLLLKSKNGFETIEKTQTFFDQENTEEDLLGWTKENATCEEVNEKYTIVVKNNADEVEAIHPFEYETATECEDRLLALQYYLYPEPRTCTTKEEAPGIFKFEIRDANDNVHWESVDTFSTEMEARTAAAKVRALSRHRVYYQVRDDLSASLPFGFELLDRKGVVVARHPQAYATDCERDLAMDVVVYCASNVTINFEVKETEAGWIYVLLKNDGTPLMQSQNTYPDQEVAQTAWQEFLNLVVLETNYRFRILDDEDCPYTFDLLNETEEIIASSTISYHTEAERNMALRMVLNYLCHTAFTIEVTGTPGVYHFCLENEVGRIFLDSAHVYVDEHAVKVACQAVLEAAKNEENYHLLPNYGFELKDAESNLLALHPTQYTSDTEREAAIQLIIAFVRNDTPVIETPNTGGAFFVEIFDLNETLLLRGTSISSNQEAAELAKDELLKYATCAENYQQHDKGHANCKFGFHLLDNEGNQVATHPKQYPSEALRDEALFHAYILLTNGETLTNKVVQNKSSEEEQLFCIELKDFHGNVLLTHSTSYNTSEEAQNAWLQTVLPAALNPDNYLIDYDNATCSYAFQLVVHDTELAKHPITNYPNRKVVKELITDILCLLQSHELPCKIQGQDCGYFFKLKKEDSGVVLKGLQHYPSEANAHQACNEITPLLKSEDTFLIFEQEEKWWLAIENEAGKRVAKSYESFDNETLATEERATWMNELDGETTLSATTIQKERRVKCQIKQDEVILLESLDGQPFTSLTKISAPFSNQEARDEKVRLWMEFFKDKDTNFQSATDITPELGYVVTTGFDKLESPTNLPDQERAIKQYNQLFDFGKTKAAYLLHNDAEKCTYTFEIIHPKAQEEVWQACNELLELGLDSTHYNMVTDEDACLYGFELEGDSGITLASHPDFYSTTADRDAALANLQTQINDEGLHLVEHLLLRPKNKGLTPSFYFDFEIPYGAHLPTEVGQIDRVFLFQSTKIYSTKDAACTDFQTIWNTIHQYDPTNAQPTIIKTTLNDATSTDCAFSFEIQDAAGKILATPYGYFTEAERDVTLSWLQKYFLDRFGIPTVDMIDCDFLQNQRTFREMESDKLLPIVGDCFDDSGNLCPDKSDSYSFRLSIVLPYWPERFQKAEFRAFIETTIRRETPAHIFPRICWVDACQMHLFETAYRAWLESKANGEDSCNAIAALNDLTDILFQLRNTYPEARLHNCETPSNESNVIILNQTILGSANSNDDDNQ